MVCHLWRAEFSLTILEFKLTWGKAEHSVFCCSKSSRHIPLVVYVDNIVMTGDDDVSIA